MTIQLSTAVKNAMLNALEVAIGTSPKLALYTGAPPANPAASATGTKLAEITLPSDWLAAAVNGTISKLGSWVTLSALASGDSGYFRITDNAGTTCHLQGTVTATGGNGDMLLDAITIAASQAVEVSSFQLTSNN